MGGLTAAVAVAGCSDIIGNDVQDSDGDGVIDSEDYAPRDPSVQRKEQLLEETPTSTPTPTPTPTATPTESGAQTPTDGDGTERFMLDFEDPPEKFRPHVESINGSSKLVLRDERVEYRLPDLSGWQRMEYKIAGQAAGNTAIAFDSAADGAYGSFLGIRPWMRWRTAINDFSGARTYPNVDWEGAQPNTEYRVMIQRTGSSTGNLTVYGPAGDRVYTLGRETIFNVFTNTDEKTFVPSTVRLTSNKPAERAVFDEIIIR